MKAIDLRIGNYVNVPQEEQCPFRIDIFECMESNSGKVGMDTVIHDDPIYGKMKGHPMKWYFNDLQPISLNEEWLTKLGFERSIYDALIWKKCTVELSKTVPIFEDNIPQWGFNWYNFDGRMNRIAISYVHQLQNFYYYFMGKELTITFENNETHIQH